MGSRLAHLPIPDLVDDEQIRLDEDLDLLLDGIRQMECLLVGRDQSRLTAKVAATVADVVYSGNLPRGVFHIEQGFELASMKGWLEEEASLEVWRDGVKGII